MKTHFPGRTALAALALTLSVAQPLSALDKVTVRVIGLGGDFETEIRALSRTATLFTDQPDAESGDILGAALSDYRNIVVGLYARGYYSGVVNILVDGREAADIALLSVPDRIREVAIVVDPGRRFVFGDVAIAPLPAGGTVDLPKPGDRAESGKVADAVTATVDGWREIGHAKARPVSERVVADHPNRTLDVAIGIEPGPRAVFGDLVLAAPSAVREEAIRRIAGLPTGEVFAPGELQVVATRLRRTGAFTSVNLSEAEDLGPGNTLDIGLELADAKPRRFGFGAEISSFEGLELSGFWLHRNIFGGAERLRFDAKVSNIGGQGGGIDYATGLRLDIPAIYGPDTSAFFVARAEHLDEPDFESTSYTLGGGVSRILSDTLTVDAGAMFEYSETDDDLGQRTFTLLRFPVNGIWDRRNDALDPTSGTYVALGLSPFVGLDGSASGLRSTLDARAYRTLGEGEGLVFAGRFQLGSVYGPDLIDTRPDLLFSSGGGGSVRGQPFRSLTVDLGGGNELGGRSFLGVQTELRAAISDTFGLVAFADAGYVGRESFVDGSGDWHAGAGVGVRYKTGLGPIRLDVAAPVAGDTGDGLQLYIGIGQAF